MPWRKTMISTLRRRLTLLVIGVLMLVTAGIVLWEMCRQMRL